MKQTKVAIIATIVTIAIMLATACAMPAYAEQSDFYHLTTVVVGWERIGDTDLYVIDCMTQDGNVWSFYEDEEHWTIGDIAILYMWKCTEAEEDDEVIDVAWGGYMEVMEMVEFFRAM